MAQLLKTQDSSVKETSFSLEQELPKRLHPSPSGRLAALLGRQELQKGILSKRSATLPGFLPLTGCSSKSAVLLMLQRMRQSELTPSEQMVLKYLMDCPWSYQLQIRKFFQMEATVVSRLLKSLEARNMILTRTITRTMGWQRKYALSPLGIETVTLIFPDVAP